VETQKFNLSGQKDRKKIKKAKAKHPRIRVGIGRDIRRYPRSRAWRQAMSQELPEAGEAAAQKSLEKWLREQNEEPKERQQNPHESPKNILNSSLPVPDGYRKLQRLWIFFGKSCG